MQKRSHLLVWLRCCLMYEKEWSQFLVQPDDLASSSGSKTQITLNKKVLFSPNSGEKRSWHGFGPQSPLLPPRRRWLQNPQCPLAVQISPLALDAGWIAICLSPDDHGQAARWGQHWPNRGWREPQGYLCLPPFQTWFSWHSYYGSSCDSHFFDCLLW